MLRRAILGVAPDSTSKARLIDILDRDQRRFAEEVKAAGIVQIGDPFAGPQGAEISLMFPEIPCSCSNIPCYSVQGICPEWP
jgi:hypothetical protein